MGKKFYSGIDLASQRAQNAADPTGPADLATKSYVDNLLAGLRWKAPVRVATTANGTLASAFQNGASVDGVTLATGDRILVKDQSTGSENGIYTVNASGAPTRATDADTTAEIHGAAVYVTSGTANGDKAYVLTTDNPTLGTTAQVWAQFGGGGSSYTADGQGIELSGTTFALELDGTTLSKGASGLRVGSGAAGAGLTEASGVLAVGQGTGISVAADAVAVDTSVVVRKYAANVGALSAGTPLTITHNLNTRDVTVAVYEGTSGTAPLVDMDVAVTGVNDITLTTAAAHSADTFRVVVHG